MEATIICQGWTMNIAIVWTTAKKVITFQHIDAGTIKRYSMRDATNFVCEMVDEPIAKRLFLALLAAA